MCLRLHAIRTNHQLLRVRVPTDGTLGLPIVSNGDLGTSPLLGQAQVKLRRLTVRGSYTASGSIPNGRLGSSATKLKLSIIESASLIGRLGSSAFRLSTTAVSMSPTGSRFSSESAPRPFHHGIRGRGGAISYAALPSDKRRSKRTHELTSSIVPRGTSFHRSVELEFPPIGFDPAGSCGCDFPGPPELGAVNPDAVHDHGKSACQRHDCFFHPAPPGDLHRPGLEP